MDTPEEAPRGYNKFVRETSAWAATGAFVGTLALLAVIFPVAGAFFLGKAALGLAGTSGIGCAIGGGIIGAVTGFAPLFLISHFSLKKKESNGTIAALTMPSQYVDKAVTALLTPRKTLQNIFSGKSRRQQEQKAAGPNVLSQPASEKRAAAVSNTPTQPEWARKLEYRRRHLLDNVPGYK